LRHAVAHLRRGGRRAHSDIGAHRSDVRCDSGCGSAARARGRDDLSHLFASRSVAPRDAAEALEADPGSYLVEEPDRDQVGTAGAERLLFVEMLGMSATTAPQRARPRQEGGDQRQMTCPVAGPSGCAVADLRLPNVNGAGRNARNLAEGRNMASTAWTTDGRRRRRVAFSRARLTGVSIETWALLACAFVLGLTVAGAAFVGIWRSTARQGVHANAARAVTERRLTSALGQVDLLTAKLRAAQTGLSQARTRLQSTKTALAQTRLELGKANARLADAATIRRETSLLTQQTSTLTSDLSALGAYLDKTPNAVIDRGFVQTQLAYISSAATRLQRTTTALREAATRR
jgi:hypothetical protein